MAGGGTYATAKADKASLKAEVGIGEGMPGDPHRGRQTFRHYVEEEWFPHHRIEATARQGYASVIHEHLMPSFGDMRLRNRP
ncbi:MAG TPA: site-specific integrase, partial [Streptosporangiaceae bacterium]|nr:site-specific integrase [Streptosporangiaceae bacterium]